MMREGTLAYTRPRHAALFVCALLAAVLVAPVTGRSAPAGAAVNAIVSQYLTSHPNQAVPVIVETKGDPAPVERELVGAGASIDTEYHALNGFAATVGSTTAGELNRDPRVRRLNINAPVRWLGSVDSSHLANRYNGMSRVQNAWNSGYDGSEVQVAVVDSGVWPHDDLVTSSSYVPGNKGNRLLSVYTNSKATDVLDHYGHGTHVAGIIAGNGHDSGGKYIGVAPNSLLVSVKIADDLGNANEGDVITGLDWVYQANQHNMHIKVVNLSLQSTVAQSYELSSLDAMVEKLWFSGVTVVTAAGNNGTGNNGPVNYAPGNDPFAITVGSIDDYYQTSLAASGMASWAFYGTTQDGFAKPDVVADGSHVVSLLAPASNLSTLHPFNVVGLSYFKMGGTSMSSAVVAGIAALMLQAQPSLTNNQLKGALLAHTTAFGKTAYTSWLGTAGGFADGSAVGQINWAANGGVSRSNYFNLLNNTFEAGGAWWKDATFPSASWNGLLWNTVTFNSSAWAQCSWLGLNLPAPSLLCSYWNDVSWSNIGWSNIGWSNIGWSNIGWSNIGWSNIGWSGSTFQ